MHTMRHRWFLASVVLAVIGAFLYKFGSAYFQSNSLPLPQLPPQSDRAYANLGQRSGLQAASAASYRVGVIPRAQRHRAPVL